MWCFPPRQGMRPMREHHLWLNQQPTEQTATTVGLSRALLTNCRRVPSKVRRRSRIDYPSWNTARECIYSLPVCMHLSVGSILVRWTPSKAKLFSNNDDNWKIGSKLAPVISRVSFSKMTARRIKRQVWASLLSVEVTCMPVRTIPLMSRVCFLVALYKITSTVSHVNDIFTSAFITDISRAV